MSRGEGGSATAIKGEGVTMSCSSDSDRNALYRWSVNWQSGFITMSVNWQEWYMILTAKAGWSVREQVSEEEQQEQGRWRTSWKEGLRKGRWKVWEWWGFYLKDWLPHGRGSFVWSASRVMSFISCTSVIISHHLFSRYHLPSSASTTLLFVVVIHHQVPATSHHVSTWILNFITPHYLHPFKAQPSPTFLWLLLSLSSIALHRRCLLSLTHMRYCHKWLNKEYQIEIWG